MSSVRVGFVESSPCDPVRRDTLRAKGCINTQPYVNHIYQYSWVGTPNIDETQRRGSLIRVKRNGDCFDQTPQAKTRHVHLLNGWICNLVFVRNKEKKITTVTV